MSEIPLYPFSGHSCSRRLVIEAVQLLLPGRCNKAVLQLNSPQHGRVAAERAAACNLDPRARAALVTPCYRSLPK
eukprot:CAMPEP_0180142102 /NCGR_PEP_ID=MMETSP0986-20121125/15375_1 /TAXON_ID=697907 /ORGANISM="non described non described, Strain CCMP2293" /LENGTH=74 /DNA_ID=CAMNT_0022085225 /DNA_START=190 /DNA_END=414 /DNA_ORIENTATION=+